MEHDDLVPIAENISEAIIEQIPVDISGYKQAKDIVYGIVLDVLLTDLGED